MSWSGAVPPGTDAVPTAAELRRAIASVTGVTTAEVTRGDNGRDRLRISLAPGEDAEAVAWSVAATLRERFGIALDPAAITARAIAHPSDDPVRVVRADGEVDEPSPTDDTGTPPAAASVEPAWTSAGAVADGTEPAAVPPPPPVPPPPGPRASDDLVAAARAALADPDPGAAPRPPRQRAAIHELTASPDGDDLDVAATLRLSGREVTGRARGVRTRRGRWRAIAEATLAALADLSGDRVHGHVDHVTVLTFADLSHVSVSVTLLTDRGEETFLGAALVRDDPDRAVMRAALDAVNRRVEPWLVDARVSEAG